VPKTYVPTANFLAVQFHKFLTRYQPKLVEGKSSDQITALTNLIACLLNFINDWPKPPVNP